MLRRRQQVYAIICDHNAVDASRVARDRFQPEFELRRVEKTATEMLYLIATSLADAGKQACHLEFCKGSRSPARRTTRGAPFPASVLDRSILGVRQATSRRSGHGAVHTAPAHGVDDFYTRRTLRLSQVTSLDALVASRTDC